MLRSLVTVFVAAFVIVSSGCRTDSARQRAEKTVDSIVDTRIELVKTQNDLHDTVFALRELKKMPADPKPAYAKFTHALERARKQAEDAREAAVDMRQRSAEYEKQWEQETSTLSNPDLKRSAEERLAEFRSKYSRLRELREESSTLYAAFVTDLEEVKKYLANDLTRPGLEAAQPAIDKSIERGEALTTKVADLIAEINTLTASMTPTGKVPEK